MSKTNNPTCAGFPSKSVIPLPNLDTIPFLKEGAKSILKFQVEIIRQNFMRIFPFLPKNIDAGDLKKREYQFELATRIYKYALYPMSVAYLGELDYLQFSFDPFYALSDLVGQTWICDNLYYRFRSSFMMPVIGKFDCGNFYIEPTQSTHFNYFKRLMRSLYLADEERYIEFFNRKVFIWCSTLIVDIMDAHLFVYNDNTEYFDKLTHRLSLYLRRFEDMPNCTLYIGHVSLANMVSPSMCAQLQWKDLLVDYRFDDCLVASALYQS